MENVTGKPHKLRKEKFVVFSVFLIFFGCVASISIYMCVVV